MTAGAAESVEAACQKALDALLTRGAPLTADELSALGRVPADVLDRTLGALARAQGEAALPLLTALAADVAARPLRRAARRALFRLGQRGIRPESAPTRPVVTRRTERAVRAWGSGVDGAGSRALWIVFEDSWAGLRLCSLIVNDAAGILEVAGGDISRKRLERELANLRAAQKLPWVETDPARAVGLVAEALALHRASNSTPPAAFGRWASLFVSAPAVAPPAPPAEADPALVERAAELLELPELAGWFLEPEAVQADAVELLEARESRLVLADHLKAQREASIVRRVVERELGPAARRVWARRLLEMALVFDTLDRTEHAALARAAAAALADETRDPGGQPFAGALARRALAVAAEVALGRVSLAEVSRRPRPPGEP